MAKSPLLAHAQHAPLFVLSFRYRDELAAMASRGGWQVIAARRDEGAVQRFQASGAIIAIVDMRGAPAAALTAITALSELVAANGAALLVIGPRGKVELLEAAMTAGATHVLSAPFSEARFILALRSAERLALRLIERVGLSSQEDIWRDQQLSWERHGKTVHLSPALSARMRLDSNVISFEKWLDQMPREARDALLDVIAHINTDGRPRALTHRLRPNDPFPMAHHLRLDPKRQDLQGLIERPLIEARPASERMNDPLTGLRSKAGARQWLTLHSAVPQVALLIGLTQFKMINGAFGRLTGDNVLRAIGRRIERIVTTVFPEDVLLARTSGTNFLIVSSGKTTPARIELLVAELADAIERPVVSEGHEVRVSCAIGGVERHEREDAASLLTRVSTALAQTQSPGASRVHLTDAAGMATARHHDALQTDLRTALDRNEIDILFQPQVAISTGEIVGVEALARWQHPQLGQLGAGTLFAVAERSDYIGALSAHIQKRALDMAARWPTALAHLRLSLNVTAQDIARSGFAQSFLKMLDSSGFPRARLTVEITESGLIDDLDQAADLLAALRQGGCRIAIDDFGTGYSSLAYLKALPLDYLKIDKALAQDIVGTARDRIVVRGVIDMARSLGLAVIAEGVETEEQLAALAAQGCNYYQGFLKAEALDVAALEKLVVSG